jgi:hypothetical protein
MFTLIVIGGIVLVAGLAYLSYRANQRRKAALQAFALRHNLYFTERDDSILVRWEPYGGAFDDGFDHQARNIIHGEWEGRHVNAFEYRFHTWETQTDGQGHTTQTKQSHDRGVVALETGYFFPLLSVNSENMFTRMVGRLTGSDINLEWEDFNRRFTVRCPDRKLATDILTPQMMELLMREPRTGWTLVGPDIMLVTQGSLDPDSVLVTLQLLSRSIDLIPEHVKDGAGLAITPRSTLELP